MKCWWCNNDLVEKDGKLVYGIFVDQLGNEHKVHKSCVKTCEQESKPVTAQAVGEICPISRMIYRSARIQDEE